MKTEKVTFSGKLGFVLSAAGAAVGLGNIWRFPYLAARYGGGIFLFVYFILAVTLGFSLLVCEIAIGRKTKKSAMEAFKALDKRFSFIGYGAIVIPVLILPYYSVVGGWVLKYFTAYLTGGGDQVRADGFFAEHISGKAEPVLWLLIFMAITVAVVLLGVEKGIEKMSRVIMPSLLAFMLFIAIYSVFSVDGGIEGVWHYIKPDFSKLSVMTVAAAMGQMFYSMSLALGVMITYGSYLKKDVSIEKSARQIELFDTAIAFLSGLMIVPTVYAFSGGGAGALEGGKGLMFVTLPKIFSTMPGGNVLGGAFFLCVFFAALTSAVSIMETMVRAICDKWGGGRKGASFFVGGFCALLGIFPTFGYSIWSGVRLFGLDLLDFFDFLSNNIVIPVVALCTCILVGYAVRPESITEEVELSGSFKRKKLFCITVKYAAPICIILILITSILEITQVIQI